jgi:N-acetylated-alpha-linked acidic dipeptidase
VLSFPAFDLYMAREKHWKRQDGEKRTTMPHERAPLLERVPVAEPTDRYPHTSVPLPITSSKKASLADRTLQVRRFCTVVLIAVPLLTLAIVFFCVAVGGDNDLFGDRGRLTPSTAPHTELSELPHPSWPQSDGISYTELKDILLETPSADKAREWSKYYTAGPHLAGKNLSQAEWTRDRWAEWGVKSHITAYNVYINYPLGHRLALLKDGEVDFEATLEEDVLEDDPTTGLEDRVPVFHGYSANGNATAQYVFVNYGTYYDFEELVKAGIELKGKIALVKYGRIFRGLKVKRAEELGMLGVVIYSDPGDDGEITEENGYKPYPEGPARHPRAVQRGSVEYLSKFCYAAPRLLRRLTLYRHRTRRPNDHWLPIETWSSSSANRRQDSHDPFSSTLLRRSHTSASSS